MEPMDFKSFITYFLSLQYSRRNLSEINHRTRKLHSICVEISTSTLYNTISFIEHQNIAMIIIA